MPPPADDFRTSRLIDLDNAVLVVKA